MTSLFIETREYMSTNYKYCLLFIFLLFSGMSFGQSYCERYGQECAFAASFYETRRTDFEQAAERTGLSQLSICIVLTK
jgi:hypothetical protein